eukprot:137966-Alexandrium_andersonii.AAC.1
MASACKTGLAQRAPVSRVRLAAVHSPGRGLWASLSEPNSAGPAVPLGRSGSQGSRGLHEDPADAAHLR